MMVNNEDINSLSIENILERINNSSNINEAKTLCLFASSLFSNNQYLLIQRYLISIKERDFNVSIQLFWRLFNNNSFKEYIVLVVLKFLEKEIEDLEYYDFIKKNYRDQFQKIFIDSGDDNEDIANNYSNENKKDKLKLNTILNKLAKSLNHLSFYISEIDSLNKFFNPITFLLNNNNSNDNNNKNKNKNDSNNKNNNNYNYNNNFLKILEIIQKSCQYLNENENYEHSILLYLLIKGKFENKINTFIKSSKKEDQDIKLKIKKFWFNGIQSLYLFKNKYSSKIEIEPPLPMKSYFDDDYDQQQQQQQKGSKEDEEDIEKQKKSLANEIELFLLPINRFCLPIIFHIENEEFEQSDIKGNNDGGISSKLEIVDQCWKYYICKGDDITDESILEIQKFLQQFADSGKHLKRHQNNSILNFSINLLSNPEKARNDYFDRNSEGNGDENDENSQESNDSYEFEIHLGIYLLSSLLYISSWRYFKFLVTGSSNIEKQNIQTIGTLKKNQILLFDANFSSSFSNSNSINNNNNNNNTTTNTNNNNNNKNNIISQQSYYNQGQQPHLSMITHQVLYYSNVDDESSFDDEFPKIVFTKQQTEAIKHLTLCMECFNDLNQEPWINDFKKILSTTWNNSKFYWLLNSLADSHYYYESYSISLKYYKDIKTMIKKLDGANTLIPIGDSKKRLFNPNDELWFNRLLLNIGMTNHSEIEDSIICLLEILISISIPPPPSSSSSSNPSSSNNDLFNQQLVPSKHTFKTIKPYLTVFSEEEILFWCIDTLATCYERLGMVGEITVLYQAYWSYYKPRFYQIINEIKGIPNHNPNLIPLSNLVKKDLQIGYFFPRFFDYIINIEMLEEFCFILNKGFKLDILQRNQTVSSNREMIDIIKRHITITTSNNNLTIPILLKQFFNEELDHFLIKKENREKQYSNSTTANNSGVNNSPIHTQNTDVEMNE
ncbi:hypothetical protein ACTFIU_008247 [Dictyostelium citrinum]